MLPNGTKVEVTELMKLDFSETTCGDSLCNLPETHATCPQDCPSASNDEYCDAVRDGKTAASPPAKSSVTGEFSVFTPIWLVL